MTIKEKIEELTGRLTELSRKQEAFGKEIDSIRAELLALKMVEAQEEIIQHIKTTEPEEALLAPPVETTQPVVVPIEEEKKPKSTPQLPPIDKSKLRTLNTSSQSLEKYIGENLISKIGILITIIGVAIGAKYSFDNGWVSPLMRIILGYVMGIGLFGIGYRLKSKYENYSAVLVSGAMAIMYFITFIAYSVYGLIPKIAAFDVMAVFTVFTVVISIHYNRQIIALIGLVGAYAVPFFTSDGSGNIESLFAYMTIINIGILVIAFRRYWKLLYYSAFIVSWLIFLVWFGDSNNDISANISETAIIYGAVFFIIFYAAILAYKLIQKEKYNESDLVLLLANASIYYYVGCVSLNGTTVANYLGLFSFGNVVLHSIVGFLIYKQQLADKRLFHTVIGIMLIILAITIPLQFDEKWFVPLWIGIASVLFWLGRSRTNAFYERFSHIYIFLAFFGMIAHWAFAYNTFWSYMSAEDLTQPILNTNFLITALFILGIGFINWLHRQSHYTKPLAHKVGLSNFMSFMLPSIFLVSIYYLFRFEINYLFDHLLFDSRVEVLDPDRTSGYSYATDESLEIFRNVWLLNYSLFFLVVLAWFNLKRIKSQRIGFFNLGLNLIGVMFFLTQGLSYFYTLQEFYISKVLGSYSNLGIRYLSYAFLVGILYRSYQYNFASFMQLSERRVLDIVVHFISIIILSFELVSWMEFFGASNSTKLGLSILWSIYAVGLVVIGIWRQHAHLRFAAIAIFGVTLLKLFFYDIAHLDTISKTIVFVVIGLLLLLVSYLYNRYKDVIVGDD